MAFDLSKMLMASFLRASGLRPGAEGQSMFATDATQMPRISRNCVFSLLLCAKHLGDAIVAKATITIRSSLFISLYSSYFLFSFTLFITLSM